MMPGNAKLRHVEIEKRNLELAEVANTLPINQVEMNDTKIGVITSGIPYQYVKEAMPDASVLKLGMVNPLPRKLIEEFRFQSREVIYCRRAGSGDRRTGKILGNQSNR